VPDTDDEDSQPSVSDRIDDAVIAGPYAVNIIFGRKLDRAIRPRVDCERIDGARDANLNRSVELPQRARRG